MYGRSTSSALQNRTSDWHCWIHVRPARDQTKEEVPFERYEAAYPRNNAALRRPGPDPGNKITRSGGFRLLAEAGGTRLACGLRSYRVPIHQPGLPLPRIEHSPRHALVAGLMCVEAFEVLLVVGSWPGPCVRRAAQRQPEQAKAGHDLVAANLAVAACLSLAPGSPQDFLAEFSVDREKFRSCQCDPSKMRQGFRRGAPATKLKYDPHVQTPTL